MPGKRRRSGAAPSGARARWPGRAALAAVCVGAALRMWDLPRQGLLFYDEGHMIREAAATRRMWAASAAAAAGSTEGLHLLRDELRNSRIGFAKPAHNALLAVFLTVVPRADQAALWLSALAGTACIALAYGIGCRWFDPSVGAVAASLLAVSPLHVMFSRMALAETLPLACWMGALAALPRTRRRSAWAAGTLLGLGCAANYRLVILIPLMPWMAARAIDEPRTAPRTMAVYGAQVLVAVFAVLTLMQVPWWIWSAVGPVGPPGQTYFAQLHRLFRVHAGQPLGLSGLASFPSMLWSWEGRLSLGVALGALLVRQRRWAALDGPLNAIVWWPWMVMSVAWFAAPRCFTIVLGPLALLEAAAFVELARLRGRTFRLPLLAAGVGLLLSQGWTCLAEIPDRTPAKAVADYLQARGVARHVSSDANLAVAYLGRLSAFPIPESPVLLEAARRDGVRYAVLGPQIWFGGYGFDAERARMARWIIGHCREVAAFSYTPRQIERFILEQPIAHAELVELAREAAKLPLALRVYDLEGPPEGKEPGGNREGAGKAQGKRGDGKSGL